MQLKQISYPDIPQETRQAAGSLFGKGNIYLRVGDHLNELLVDLIPQDLKACCIKDRTLEYLLLYAMLTIFQFVEELTNQQMSEAVRSRVELKYALHLPMSGLSIDSNALCEFRQQILSDAASIKIFQNLLDRLVGFGLFAPVKDRIVDAYQVLLTVCTLNQLDEASEAMHQALESLAVTDPDWLRRVTLPHWYERYARGRRLHPCPFSEELWRAKSLQIAADIHYLLGEIDRSNNEKLTSLPEIQEVRRIWEDQYVLSSEGMSLQQKFDWRPTKCIYCRMHAGAQEVECAIF